LAIPPGADGAATRRAAVALGELRVEDAARGIEPVARRHGDDADVLDVLAHVRFHEGDYPEAARLMERAIALGPTASELAIRREMHGIMGATVEATRGFVDARSSDGRFVVSHAPGRDEVLVAYALDAMQRADDALFDVLGLRVPGPVRLEVYPTAASLSAVSSLSVEEIERTGTIALCKWDRLMITSPRALVRGYPWTDTIGHEYVHLVLARASRDRAPVWLQEGVAKFLERTWRGEAPRATLDPAVEALLARAVRDDELIPFERLHPSIARLPSQEDAALAFAQVATFVESFHSRHGNEGLRDAVARIAAGSDTRDALAAVAAEPFAQLERRWLGALRRRPAPADPPRMISMRFRHGSGEVDESREIEVESARRFLRLGDLLFDRGRAGAAASEYEKAHAQAPDDPIVASRLARAALVAGRSRVALRALEPLAERYPDHAPLRAALGMALLAEGRTEDARDELVEAIRINPFDPEPHCGLGRAAATERERSRESEQCATLGGVR
jgi:Flp pilus assembly protein TadD